MRRWELHHADCRDAMRAMAAESVDAVVTDPPYGLAFMGREWDHGVPGVEFWREALRVAKPGAHLVAFGGTRTFHRLACAIEDAGWEVRDCLSWLYGSGFPKSLDVSKAIDKGSAETRDRSLRFTSWMRSTGITVDQINAATKSSMGSHYLTDKSQPAIATADMFDLLRPHLPEVPEEIERLVAERTGIEWTAYKQRAVVGHAKVPIGHGFAGEVYQGTGNTGSKNIPLTAPATDAARAWQGWGTALKPAWEPVILARKPLDGTVAANVLAHGTGAINVDACRIGWRNEADVAAAAAAIRYETARARKTVVQSPAIGKESRDGTEHYDPHAVTGRWPANVALDEEAAAMLGEPSRFFYCAKASRSERGEANTHPTLKPLALMRWLVRLVCPPGGLVLDPFNGSGSTGVAALAEGMRYVGCEREAEYVEITRRRLASPWEDDEPDEVDANDKPAPRAAVQLEFWR